MLDKVKMALRITSNVFDSELTGLIASAKLDLGIAGVTLPTTLDDICTTAVMALPRPSLLPITTSSTR